MNDIAAEYMDRGVPPRVYDCSSIPQPTFGIVTALSKEFTAVATMLDNALRLSCHGRVVQQYLWGEVPSQFGDAHSVVVALLPAMGNNPAAGQIVRLLDTFPTITHVVMVGIAGAAPFPEKPAEHVRLGDIVVSGKEGVVQYDFIAQTLDEVRHRSPPRPPSAELLNAVALLQAYELFGDKPWLGCLSRADDLPGFARPADELDRLAAQPPDVGWIAHPDDPQRLPGKPRVFVGTIGSANILLRDPQKRDRIRDLFGVRAFEMEGSGVADASWMQEASYLVIRGTCDYCDGNKNDDWQEYAAIVAAAYCRALLASIQVRQPRYLSDAHVWDRRFAAAPVPYLSFGMARSGPAAAVVSATVPVVDTQSPQDEKEHELQADQQAAPTNVDEIKVSPDSGDAVAASVLATQLGNGAAVGVSDEPSSRPVEAVGDACEATIETELEQGEKDDGLQAEQQSKSIEVDEIKASLDCGDVVTADVLATRLRNRPGLELSDVQHWRLLTLAADAKLRQNHLADATALLHEALTHAPESEHAVINVIRALRMNDDSAGARQKAKEVLEKFPKSAAVHGQLIELAETTEEAAARLVAVPDDIRDSVEILIGIATRLDLPQSEAAVRQAVAKYPEEVSAWHVLGRRLLDKELSKFSPVESGPADAPRRGGLEEAIEAFARAIELAKRQGNRGVEADTLTRRSAAYGQLGDWERAAQDTERALELAPGSQLVLLDAARIAEARRDLEGAVRYLRKARAIAETEEIRFFLGIALWNRKGAVEQDEAIELLEQVACEDCPYAESALEMAVEGYLLKGKAEVAAKLVVRAAAHVDASATLAHQSRLAKGKGDAETAERLATEAIAAVTDETSRDAKRLLAKNLMFLGRFGDALPILQQLAVPGATDESGRRLVDCAMRVDRQDVVLEYCAKARAADVFDPFLLERELRILEQVNPPKAIEVLQAIVERDPTDHAARVHLAVIAIRENRLELLREQVPLLPKVEEVDAWDGAKVVGILKTAGRADAAGDYAYDLLRRNFADVHAHRAYRDVFLFNRTEDLVLEYDEVIPGSAVEVVEAGQSTGRWFVIEDSKVEASGVENEIKPESPLAQLLLKRRKGDEVNLASVPGFERKVTVNEIVPKKVFRLRDVLAQWQFRFPDNQELLQQHLDRVDGEPDIRPILEWIEATRRSHDELLEIYRTSPVTIHVLAEAWGISDVEALWQLAHREGIPIRCCIGTEPEIRRAIAAFEHATEVVLDLSAIASLAMLGCLDEVAALGKQLILSPTTMATIRHLGSSCRFPMGWEGTIGDKWNGAELFGEAMRETEQRAAFFVRLIEFCGKNCRVADATCAANLDPAHRAMLGEHLGPAGIESVALAAEPGRILWSDDGVAVYRAAQVLKLPRIWTQLVYTHSMARGKIAQSRFIELSAKLIGCGYGFSQSTPEILDECGRLAQWKFDRWPFKQGIDLLGDESTRLEPALGMGAKLIARAYLELVVPEDRHRVLISVMTALGRRGDVREADLDDFRQVLIRAFGPINVVAGRDAVQTLDAWRKGRWVV